MLVPPMVAVPPDGPATVELTDRGAGRRWSVRVQPFLLAATVVTRGLWDEVHGTDGGADPQLPVVEVSWREAVDFCNALSRRDGLTPVYRVEPVEVPEEAGWVPHDRPAPDDVRVTWERDADGYRLPTDAEWELACRAGTAGAHYGPLDEIAWYRGTSGNRLHPPGGKRPNPWGLYDMLGGVWEWCWELFDPEVYGPYRVIRGGGWADPAWSCRAGVRRKTQPTARFDDLGFRVARNRGPRD